MEDRYYTPDERDFYVGYEYETLFGGRWSKKVCCADDFQFISFFLHATNTEKPIFHIRTPYLTKEQIEAEGWEPSFYKDSENPHFIKKEFECFIHENNVITIVTESYKFLYKGECKSINEFKYVCKLLKI